MSTKTSQENHPKSILKRYSGNSAKSRRTIKLLVEMSIGIIGLIGIMLAQIAETQGGKLSVHGVENQSYIMSNIGRGLSDKVESLSQASPAVSQITLANILF